MTTRCLVVALTTKLLGNRALRRMASLVSLLVLWVLAGACQRHGVGVLMMMN